MVQIKYYKSKCPRLNIINLNVDIKNKILNGIQNLKILFQLIIINY